MKKNIFPYALLSMTLMSGCASIVKKPDIDHVKTAAIVSIYANNDVPEKKGRGSVRGWNDLKKEVSSDFLGIYADSFQELGWKVVSADKLIKSKEYEEAFRPTVKSNNETVKKLASFANKFADFKEQLSFFTPEGMHPIGLSNKDTHSISINNGKRVDVRSKLAEYAKELNVDAVAVVQIDYCYEGGTFSSLGGTGKAYMTAASTVRAVDKNGKMVVNMGDISPCADKKNRGKSEQGYAMVGGNLVIGLAKEETARKMFSQATKENAKLTIAELKKAMK